MPKSIWFPDEDYAELVLLAKQAGFRVSRGRGSQLRLFVMAAANTASSGLAVVAPPQALSKPKKLSARKALSKPSANR